jgi:hypothetical protein
MINNLNKCIYVHIRVQNYMKLFHFNQSKLTYFYFYITELGAMRKGVPTTCLSNYILRFSLAVLRPFCDGMSTNERSID